MLFKAALDSTGTEVRRSRHGDQQTGRLVGPKGKWLEHLDKVVKGQTPGFWLVGERN